DQIGLMRLQGLVQDTTVSDALLDYLQAILHCSRNSCHYIHGLSPRAGLALLHCAHAWAFLVGRDFVLPEDVQAVLPSVANHRLQTSGFGQGDMDSIDHLIQSVSVS